MWVELVSNYLKQKSFDLVNCVYLMMVQQLRAVMQSGNQRSIPNLAVEEYLNHLFLSSQMLLNLPCSRHFLFLNFRFPASAVISFSF